MTERLTEWISVFGGAMTLDAIKTMVLIVSLLLLRMLLRRAVAKMPGLNVEDRRRWIISIRNGLLLLFIVGMVFLWGQEVQTFAVSLVALAVALVLATKELILCLSGSVLRVGSNAYSIGDRIQVGSHRGIVLDQNWLTTTLLEIGPGNMSHLFTGRTVVVPNSLLLTTPFVNETYTKDYVFQVMPFPLSTSDDWHAAERLLLEAAREQCAPFFENARAHMRLLEEKNLLETPSPEPRVTVQIADPGRINLLLRLPLPERGRGRIEQAIIRRFLTEFPQAKVPSGTGGGSGGPFRPGGVS